MKRKSTQRNVEIFNFSFLDIIACTVGALIFVLVMFMLNASQEAARATSPERKQDLISGIEAAKKGQAEIALLEDKFAAAKEEAASLGIAEGDTKEKLQTEYENLMQENRLLYDQLEQLEMESSNTEDAPLGIWVEVLPSRESKDRDPRLVECRSNEILLVQEGVTESLRRTMESSSRWSALKNEVSHRRKNAFVLFLIRPGGIATFKRLRAQLKSRDIPFGYEPILNNWVILGKENGDNQQAE